MSIKGIIRQAQGSHWYSKDGTPMFEVPSADGKRTVKTNITHARKLDLYPSVTTVMKVLDKPDIDTWRVERAIKASIASKRQHGERIKQFIERILDRAQSKSTNAVEFGSDVHKYIEGLYTGNNFDSVLIPQATKDALAAYFKANVASAKCEQLAINHSMGYAGTIDMDAVLTDTSEFHNCLYDFKTQGTKPGKPAMFYDDFIIQLGAYSLCGSYGCIRSLIISSTEPGRIEVKEYTEQETRKGQDIFRHLTALFRLIKGLPLHGGK